MKTLFLVITLALCLVGTSPAIPQQVGGFFGAVGQQFEDFAIAALLPGAELKGKWAPVRGRDGVLKSELDATVFGVAAAGITVEKKDAQAVKFRVVFRGEKRPASAPLHDRVLAGLRAYTGADGKSEGATTTAFEHKGARITATRAGVETVVEFTKA